MAIDRAAAARAINEFLTALGHPPNNDPDLAETGERVADAWADEILDGYHVDVGALLAAESAPINPDVERGLVVLVESEVVTMCPHHLMPALGFATVAYDPGARLAGIGVITRVVDALAHRLTLQETIGEEVVRALNEHLGARGAYCHLSMRHGCLSGRGERKGARVETIAAAGSLGSGGAKAATLFAHLQHRRSP
jgi:GTP cyclohydrolase I